MKASGLIIGGNVVPCDMPVHNWTDHGLQFKVGQGARRRFKKTAIDLFVWHWTGGLGGIKALFRVLEQRDLGVEFFIDDGAIYQFADPIAVDTFDAGKFNPRSIGCEIQNWGFVGKGRPPPKSDPREMYNTRMNGKPRQFARFAPEDIRAAMALGIACSAAIPTLPAMIPVGQDGRLFRDFIGGAGRGSWMENVQGHIGHYMINAAKSDPGHDLLQGFIDSGQFAPWHVPEARAA
jgi:hypothetical protein